ncbi:MAG: hypothetical protein WD058_07320 [Dehalococcoidia bacterium]
MASSRLVTLGAMAGLVLASVAGVFAGLGLAERANEQRVETLVLAAPASAEARDPALRSAGGFTGFEPSAIAGTVTRSGQIAPGGGETFEVVTGAASMRVSTTSYVRLFHIEAADAALAAGDLVVVRTDEDGGAAAVLRVPPDLREGDSR